MSSIQQPNAEVFLAEADDLLAELEAGLLDLEARPDDADQVNRVFRALHTIKGSGAVFGFDHVAAFTHQVENAFQRVRDGEVSVSPALLEVTLVSLDHIRSLLKGEEDPEREAWIKDRLATLWPDGAETDATDTPPRTDTDTDTSGSAPSADDLRTWHIRLTLAPDVMAFGTNCLRLLDELKALGTCITIALPDAIPPLAEMAPEACYMAWDIFLTTDQPRSAIDDIFLFVADGADIQVEPLEPEDIPRRLGEILVDRGDISATTVASTLQRQRPLGELLVDSGELSSERVVSALVEQRTRAQTGGSVASGAAGGADGARRSIRVQAERLDSLMDLVGELVIAQARLTRLSDDADNPHLRDVAEDIERLSTDLRETTMGIRMVPIATLFGRFRRVVRDVSRDLGKSVDLTMEGEESELDKTVIERLNDPLVHLIRNCIDHGLETAEERIRLGKSPNGHLHLSAAHSGTQVLISVIDDGRGMNREAIRAKAEERGLLAPDAVLSDSELLAHVFHPGFSTAHEVNAVSGRGVGMDVVKRTIDSLRGTIEISSTPDQGTTVSLRLPLTLAIIDGLLVRVGRGHYVIPLSAVEECVELPATTRQEKDGCDFLNIRDTLVPFLWLRELFQADTPPDPHQKIVVAAAEGSRIGLVVDQVVGQHQTVIKSLGRVLAHVRDFSGATILGDGTVALIIDVPRLVKMRPPAGSEDNRRLTAMEAHP